MSAMLDSLLDAERLAECLSHDQEEQAVEQTDQKDCEQREEVQRG